MVCANTSIYGDGFWLGLAPDEEAAAADEDRGWFNFDEDAMRGFP